nr:MAG TPA: hypothetical protein [Caudovirales sp. ct8Ze27]
MRKANWEAYLYIRSVLILISTLFIHQRQYGKVLSPHHHVLR